MKIRKTFGMGCFKFHLSENVGSTIVVKDYIDKLNNSLESVKGIKNLRISFDEAYKNAHIPVDKYSKPEFMNIFFSLEIPYETQEELLKKHGILRLERISEKFNVFILDAYFESVAFIEVVDYQGDEPSWSIIVVREFLENQLNEKGGLFRFEIVGPSPFHRDFSIELKDISDKNFELNRIARKGYDRMRFFGSRKFFKDLNHAFIALIEILKDEASLFYGVHTSRSERIDEWGKLEKELKSVDLVRKSRFWQLLSLPKIENLVNKIVVFRISQVWDKQIYQEGFDDLYKGTENFLKEDNEKCLVPEPYPTEEILNLLEIYRENTSTYLESYSLIVSAILGVVIGFVLGRF